MAEPRNAIATAKYAIKYLKGTCEYGIQFTSDDNIDLSVLSTSHLKQNKSQAYVMQTGDHKTNRFQKKEKRIKI